MILPTPLELTRTAGEFVLDRDTAVQAGDGAGSAAALLRTLLAPATGLPLPLAGDGAVQLALTGGTGEGYRLSVTPEGVRLTAATPAGLRHGVQTLRQLLPPEALSPHPVTGTVWRLPGVEITDAPRHGWRGALLDVARHFQPLPFLLRAVDLLALHKLNVLHLHLTDDQGWRFPVDAYPRLVEVGSRRSRSMVGQAGSAEYDDQPHQGAYTKGELAELVRYAAVRGVTVLPEIGMPSHTRAALAAYPALGNRPDRQLDVWTEWGVCENILGVHEPVLDFCRTVLGEVTDLFPSRYVHLGGDECPTVEWEQSPAAVTRAAELGLASPKELHGWFLGQVGSYLLENGRNPVCWAEDSTSALPPEFAVMPWRDGDHGLAAARRGHDVIMAPHRSTYLDYPQRDHPDEPVGQAGVVVDLATVHANEPTPSHWTEAERGRVLGTQAQFWSEFIATQDAFDHLAFPRLAALADRAWNPASGYTTDFLPALPGHERRLAAFGVRAGR
ncbi:beta-N-acetylhexosaminidase [Kitasatospora sp. NPDC002040]|uniref:beta-N-acetylhexosaminidase n=1 Tax=Kitasatospora sp. NPDC002040 TaxID=3154661 RepID=UPI00332C9143